MRSRKLYNGGSKGIKESNKDLICRWFVHSDMDDDLCLGSGNFTNNKESKELKTAFESGNYIDEKFNNYLNLYGNTINTGTKEEKLFLLINIRTCGLERFLVYLDNKKVGIYLNPDILNKDNISTMIHFPIYLDSGNGKFAELRKKFHDSLLKNLGNIIGVSTGGASQSSRSKVKDAGFGIGSYEDKYVLEHGIRGQPKLVGKINKSSRGNLKKVTPKKNSPSKKNSRSPSPSRSVSSILKRGPWSGGGYEPSGIMIGQIVSNKNFNFNVLGKIVNNKLVSSKCNAGNLCSNPISSFLNSDLLSKNDKTGNPYLGDINGDLKIYTDAVYGDSEGRQNYDLKIDSKKRSNVELYCGDRINELIEVGKILGKDTMLINNKRMIEIQHEMAQLNKLLSENSYRNREWMPSREEVPDVKKRMAMKKVYKAADERAADEKRLIELKHELCQIHPEDINCKTHSGGRRHHSRRKGSKAHHAAVKKHRAKARATAKRIKMRRSSSPRRRRSSSPRRRRRSASKQSGGFLSLF